jgi:hypothetical protein
LDENDSGLLGMIVGWKWLRIVENDGWKWFGVFYNGEIFY